MILEARKKASKPDLTETLPIELHQVQKVFEKYTVLAIDTLVVASGEMIALVGPPDEGQLTLLDLLVGKIQPSLGTVRLAGCDPYQDKGAFSRKVGVMFREDSLYRNLSALDNLTFMSRMHGLPDQRAVELLAALGLADQRQTRAEKLAPSMCRRLALARALLHSPQALLAVEPFENCDDLAVEVMIDQLVLQKQAGTGILILTGSSTHIEALCERYYGFNQGRLSTPTQAQRTEQEAFPFKIPVKQEGRVVLINPGDIYFVEADGDNAIIQIEKERFSTQFTLGELEKRLKRSGFFRAHRGYLVNLQHVVEVIPFTRDSFSLRLDDASGTLIPLSKGAASELRELLGY